MDTFTDIIAPWFSGEFNGEHPEKLEIQALSAMHHTIKLYSDLGYNIIVDHVLTRWETSYGEKTRLLEECVELLHDYPLLFVRVMCPLHELKRREIERSDRDIGSAEANFNNLYPQEPYDIVVNTYENSTEECTDKIISLVDNSDNFKAFKTINSF